MTIPLDRLHATTPSPVGPGEMALLVARNEAPNWPSPEVHQYAKDRAEALHEGLDGKVEIKSWGETDGSYPREVVELILQFTHEILPHLVTVLVALIAARPTEVLAPADDSEQDDKAPGAQPAKHPIAGIKISRHDGDTLKITQMDGLSKEEMTAVLRTFLKDSKPPHKS